MQITLVNPVTIGPTTIPPGVYTVRSDPPDLILSSGDSPIRIPGLPGNKAALQIMGEVPLYVGAKIAASKAETPQPTPAPKGGAKP